ncbi:flagellar protein FlaG [Paenibacillus sp. MMS20-IR301]|uniref:flagellar protein FlaG n=1 Tax=Paenibacillus sp. MMS20-IR301 TaxID=2895946 RepID=UPI0028E9BDE5|nr:flagellar protein FlaG [Paenibacillus sp. MMS20-IR301]WNS42668.1 flagellar protein FlaG [Paenibacillus sp. MMS20-IR301]
MDVRLSGAGSYSAKPTETGSRNEQNIVKTGGSTINQVSSSEELKKMENQGVPISLGEEQVVKALDRALKALEGPSTTLEVSMHKETKTIMVKILNKETGELIREVPPEKTLDLVANMMQIAGIIVDERV